MIESPAPLFGLILAPTRELANQIKKHVEGLGSIINVRCVEITGGTPIVDQAKALQKSPHVIVATPGRLVDHLENTKGFHLRNLKYLVFDEADKASISRQVARWRFSYRDDNDRARHRAVQLAAEYLTDASRELGETSGGLNATRRSLRALEVHHLFLRSDEATGQSRAFTPGPDVLRAEPDR